MTRTLALLVSTVFACGSSSKPAEAPKPQDSHAMCVQTFTKARTCTDQFIPALVDTRAKLDKPAGIASQVGADRAAVIAEAKQEWASDSTDAAIDSMCTKMASEMAEDSATAQTCVGKSSCAEFTSCVSPLIEKHLVK